MEMPMAQSPQEEMPSQHGSLALDFEPKKIRRYFEKCLKSIFLL